MYLKQNRLKKRNIILSVLYRFFSIYKTPSIIKLKFFLTIEWIFWRLSIEEASKLYPINISAPKLENLNFLISFMKNEFSVIDIGCKSGDITYLVSNNVNEIIGIDFDNNAIELTKNLPAKDNLSFICIDAFDYVTSLSKKFDVCILSHVLEHIDNPKHFLNLYLPYFKFIYIEVPDFDYTYLNHFRVITNSDLVYSDNDHVWEFDRKYIMNLAEEIGLEIVASEYKFGVQKYWLRNINSN